MNIVMFTDSYWPMVNGVTVSVESFSQALIKNGHKVMIVCPLYPDDGRSPSLSSFDHSSQIEGLEIVKVPSMPEFISKEYRLAKIDKWFWVFRQVENFNPDIIHINSEFVISEFGFLYSKAHNLPVIYTFHTMWEDYGPNYFPDLPPKAVKLFIRGVLKNSLSRSYRVIVPTTQIDEVVHKYRPKTKTDLLPTGIEGSLFQHQPEEISAFRKKLDDRFPLLSGKRIILFAGRVAKEKNIGFLFKVLPKIVARHPDVVLLIAGNGPYLEYYQDEAKKAGLENNCIFTGMIERKELSLAYAVSEVFVFPSLTDTQGLVTLEAMFSGIPVVAIGSLGTLMVMGGDNGGFMVKDDVGEFSDRVLDLLEDKDLHSRKSIEAREHASAWSIEELTKKLINIYESSFETYKAEHGERKVLVWETIMDKNWWKTTNRLFKEKSIQRWQQILSKLGRLP
jgi:glycosyltransferase involved in cell wall biosynthesis